MKTWKKVAVFLVMNVTILTLSGCTESADVCGLLNLSYFECLALGL